MTIRGPHYTVKGPAPTNSPDVPTNLLPLLWQQSATQIFGVTQDVQPQQPYRQQYFIGPNLLLLPIAAPFKNPTDTVPVPPYRVQDFIGPNLALRPKPFSNSYTERPAPAFTRADFQFYNVVLTAPAVAAALPFSNEFTERPAQAPPKPDFQFTNVALATPVTQAPFRSFFAGRPAPALTPADFPFANLALTTVVVAAALPFRNPTDTVPVSPYRVADFIGPNLRLLPLAAPFKNPTDTVPAIPYRVLDFIGPNLALTPKPFSNSYTERPLRAFTWADFQFTNVVLTAPAVAAALPFRNPFTERSPQQYQSLKQSDFLPANIALTFPVFVAPKPFSNDLTGRPQFPQYLAYARADFQFSNIAVGIPFPLPNVRVITDTTILQLPIDAVMAGDQDDLIPPHIKTSEINKPNTQYKTIVETGGVKRVSDPSTVTTTTNNRGYD